MRNLDIKIKLGLQLVLNIEYLCFTHILMFHLFEFLKYQRNMVKTPILHYWQSRNLNLIFMLKMSNQTSGTIYIYVNISYLFFSVKS